MQSAMQSRSALLLAFVACCAASGAARAANDVFSGPNGLPIAGDVTLNEIAEQGSVALAFAPRNGQLRRPDGTAGIAADGRFTYTPNPGFRGVDQFFYTVRVDGNPQLFGVRLYSGEIRILSSFNTANAIVAGGGDNRAPVLLGSAASGTAAIWQMRGQGDRLGFRTGLNLASAMETWLPAGEGSIVSIYSANEMEWQRFEILQSRLNNDEIASSYTGRTLRVSFGNVVPGPRTSTDTDDWLISGPLQAPAPSVRNDTYSAAIDIAIAGNVLANDSINSGGAFAALVRGPAHGRLVRPFSATGAFEYVPDPGFEGADSFSYVAFGDGIGAPSYLATVELRIGTVPAVPPLARSDIFVTAQDVPFEGRVLGNDSGSILRANLVSPPRYGTLIGINQSIYGGLAPFGEFQYQPPAGFNGVDSFAYRVDGQNGLSRVATVYILAGNVRFASAHNWRVVMDAGDASQRTPVLLQTASTAPSSLQSFTPYATAVFGQYKILTRTASALETWAPNAAGTQVTMYPDNGMIWQRFRFGVDEPTGRFSIVSVYTGFELVSTSSAAGAPVTAAPLSPALTLNRWRIAGPTQSFGPVGLDDTYVVRSGETFAENVLTNDIPAGPDFSAFLVAGPQNGELVGVGQQIYGGIAPWGRFDYRPNPGFVGEDSFVYQVLGSGVGAPSRYVTVVLRVVP